MNEETAVVTTVEGEIGHIELNRPRVLNALNRLMVDEVVAALKRFDGRDDVKVIVISGRGKAFAAGADIKEMKEDEPIDLEKADPFAVWDEIDRVKKPLLCAVHGLAYGGGFELALACDLIFASPEAKFAFPEIRLGVMPGAGGTQRLTKAIGAFHALRWLWTGEEMSAKRAHEYRIVTDLFPRELLLSETMRFARKIAAQAPLSVRLIKEACKTAIDVPLQEGKQLERKNFYLLFASKDQKEGMEAFVEKRKPHFKGE